MSTKSKKKKPTLDDLVRLAHAANMRVSVELVPLPAKATAYCMVCRQPIPLRNKFNKATGLGVCKKQACREAFAEVGCV